MKDSIYPETDLLARLRIRLLRGLLLFASILSGVMLLGMLTPTELNLEVAPTYLLMICLSAAVLLLVTFLRPRMAVVYVLIAAWIGLASLGTNVPVTRVLILVIGSAFAGIILTRPLYMITASINVLSFLLLVINLQVSGDEPIRLLVLFLSVAVVPTGVGYVLNLVTRTLEGALTSASEGLNLLENSANIGGLFSQVHDERLLASIAVEAIQQNFDIEHVQIFLLEEDPRVLRFVAGTGIGEMNLLNSQYSVPMESPSAIVRAIKVRELVVVRGTAIEQDRQRSILDFLPESRAEFVFPVRDRDEALGVVDIQTERDQMISEVTVKGIQILINQFAAALQTARIFHNQERSMLENKRLFLDAQTNYREIERLNQQLTRDVWGQFLEKRQRASGITLDEREEQTSADWTQRMMEASRRRRPIRETEAERQHIAMPIELRGEVIGVVEVATAANADYDGTLEVMRSVSQRLANSLETARLLEVEREASMQEQRLSELVTRYQSAATVDELLQITLKVLAATLGAQDGSIRLGIMEAEDMSVLSVAPEGDESA